MSRPMADPVFAAQLPRYQETFPELTAQEIDRLRRYGSLRKYSDGEKLFEAGKISPGMFVVLKGLVALTQRDGLGHVTPIAEQGPGQFLADVGQLSTRATLVDGTAEGDVETLLIPTEGLRALLVAEAELGERIMRALILRRVALLQGRRRRRRPDRLAGRGGRDPAPGLSHPERLSAPSARSGARPRGQGGDRPLCRHRRRIASGGLSRRLGARQSVGAGPVASDRLDGRVAIELRLRRRGGRRRARRGSRPRSTPAPKACRSRFSTPALTAGRPGPAPGSKTTLAFRPGSAARRSPPAPSFRRRNSAPTS